MNYSILLDNIILNKLKKIVIMIKIYLNYLIFCKKKVSMFKKNSHASAMCSESYMHGCKGGKFMRAYLS